MKTQPGLIKKTSSLPFVFAIAFLLLANSGVAQKFAFIDSQYILEHIPGYNSAQATIDKLAAEWQSEIETKYTEISRLYKVFQNELPLLTAEMRKNREEEIVSKEQEVKELQQKRFGREGDLFKKREELIRPIQEKIKLALEEVATEGNYAVIFDKAGGATMVYSDPRFDISEEVLSKMGYAY
ncbi:MAG TPA: OmpH family outer membrane protein [Bacteroidales bacterium]|nr:OmpH family outer membrane protein [Bacteroidales bacterium]